MTGKMLMSEQRSVSNELRYKEAINAAQAGLDATLTRLSLDNEFRSSFKSSSIPFYQVSFDADTTIQAGTATLPVVSITSVGTSGYARDATSVLDAESRATLHEKAIVGRVVSGIPDAPLTVAAGMAAGGNFSVAANPNGGGAGVPLSIWSPTAVTIYGSSSTCAQQEYYAGNCSTSTYSDSKSGAGSDILQNDIDNFPKNLLSYVFGVSTIYELVDRLNGLHRSVLPDCNSLDTSSTGLYIVNGNCAPVSDLGSPANPIVLVVWDGDLAINGNTNIYGIVFIYSSGASSPKVQLVGGATVYGALIATANVDNSAGSYTAVYDADILKRIEDGSQFSYIARISGSWRDW